MLLKEDYANLLKVLEKVQVVGLKDAQYIAGLGEKLEQRITSWFDGHPTGFIQPTPPAPTETPAHLA